MAKTCGLRARNPSFFAVQVEPPSVERKNPPESVPRKSVLDWPAAMARIRGDVLAMVVPPIAVHVAPASVLLTSVPPVPAAYTVDAFDGSTSIELTIPDGNPPPSGAQVLPLSVDLKAPDVAPA